jgi:LysM repeat protein
MHKYNRSIWLNCAIALVASAVAGCATQTGQHSAYRSGEASTTAPAVEAATPPPAAAAPAPEPVVSEPVALREEQPLRYVVKKGDTLWGIANHFLKQAWQWPEIWYVNDQVANPHLIYPGDVLTLIWKDGRPRVVKSQGVSALNVEYLAPQVRELPLDQAIPTIPIEAIRDFLRGPRLVDADALKDAPYVLAFFEPHVVEGAGSGVYLQGVKDPQQLRYESVRLGDKYVDPDSGELLGWEAIPTAEIELRQFGDDTSIGHIARSSRESRAGDRLIKPLDDTLNANFYPQAPDKPVGGRIISLHDALSQSGQYQVVTINKGERDGMKVGHVLSVMQSQRTAKDPYSSRTIKLPPLYAGTLMLFKIESRVSYGLIMESVREIHALDSVEKPDPGQQR